ncbi:hypothetical protein JHK87_040315 [Glycine soja]|nr:hypothetical protein JHK87_040315 [Glycine soja]
MSIRFVLSNLIAKAVWTARSMSGANKKMIEALGARKKEEYLKNLKLCRIFKLYKSEKVCASRCKKCLKMQEMISKKKEMLQYPTKLKLFEPRCYDGAREADVGFMKRSCLFVVSDDLKVRQLTTTSSIQDMQELGNVKFDDVKEHMVEIRKSHEVIILAIHS